MKRPLAETAAERALREAIADIDTLTNALRAVEARLAKVERKRHAAFNPIRDHAARL